MSHLLASSRRGTRHLFVPEMPTPNGRLHLGHMSGPYLRADVMKRHLVSRGGQAYVVSGSDVYESHVELKAEQLGTSIESVCAMFHEGIREELDALAVDCDLYVNPLEPALHSQYLARNERTLRGLVERGAVESVQERVLFSRAKERYAAGCWIGGLCPLCGAKSGAYLCEECGTHYKPQDLREARARWTEPGGGEPALQPLMVESLFLKVRSREALWKHMAKMALPPAYVDIVDRYLQAQGDRVRLTNPGAWGMPYQRPDRLVFTYTALFSFSLYCADLLAAREGWERSPFDPRSDFVTVASFGIDNAVPYLVGVLASAIELGTVKPFDHYLTNYFYQLEGKKFSTSRMHLVCASKLVREAGVDADALRYFLARVNPELETRSFSVREFVGVNNDHLCGGLGALTGRAAAALDPDRVGDAPAALTARLDELLRGQDRDLALPGANLARAVSAVDAFAALGHALPADDPGQAYWWLKGLALLAHPFMPGLAGRVWTRLGMAGQPRVDAYAETPAFARAAAPLRAFAPVALEEVEKHVSRQKD